MGQNQLIFTLWSRENDFAQIRVHYNETFLSRNLRIYATKFVLLHNSKPKCFWKVRFLNKQGVPKGFYEEVANNILLTRRVLSIYGIKEELNFYNNLEFDGAQVEENNAKAFVKICDTLGIVFLDEECLEVPESSDTKVEEVEVPEEIPLTKYFGNALNLQENVAPKPSEQEPRDRSEPDPQHEVLITNPRKIKLPVRYWKFKSSASCSSTTCKQKDSNTTISNPSSTLRPITPIGEIDDPFHDHPIPSNACAQKIPSLLDLDLQPPLQGNIYISIYHNDL